MVGFDPFSAATGLASAGLTLFGQMQQQKQAAVQAALMQRQLNQQQRIADQQMELQTAGTRTARGDTTRYVPGVGWIEELSPGSRLLQGASDKEQLLRNTEDANRSREGRRQNFARRQEESSAADTLLREYRGVQGRSRAGVEGALAERNLAAVQDPLDSTRQAVQMQALRSGSGAANVLDALSQRGRLGTRSALAEARVQAPQVYEDEQSSRKSNTLNQYNTLATRASNTDDVPFEASNIADNLDLGAARSRALAPQFGGVASAALARGGAGVLDALQRQTQPNYGAAAFGVGSSLSGLYNALFNRKDQLDTNRTVGSAGSGASGYDLSGWGRGY